MSGIATAIVGSAVIGGVTSSIAGNKQATATRDASAAQQQTANAQMDLQKDMYDQTRADFEPYRQVGINAIPAFNEAVQTPFEYNPEAPSKAAEWQKQQETKALNSQLAARGFLGGGNAVQRLSDMNNRIYAQDEQNQYNRQFNEYNSSYNRLIDSLKVGQGAANSAGAANQNLAAQGTSTLQNLGNNLSNNAIQAGNNQASLYSGLGNAAMNTAALGIQSGLFNPSASTWNGSAGTIANYDPNTAYAGATPGPWAGGVS